MTNNYCPYCMNHTEPGQPCGKCGLTELTYTPSPQHLPPGTVLMDRYLVGRVLGEGGFGITYLGRDTRLDSLVAIKEYFPTDKVFRNASASLDVTSYVGPASREYEKGKDKFLDEARILAMVAKLPQIVNVRDFFAEHNTAYIVMEYIDGITLKELVNQRGGMIPAEEFMPMVEPLFKALSALHDKGLIHRDISPDNIMLENGMLRLLDFGCAREASHGTETMTIALKHGFAPTEQYNNRGQGPWTDVYALAATIYYCLTGKVPPQSIDRLSGEQMILPRELGVNITERQQRALLRAMELKISGRFQTVEQFRIELFAREESASEVTSKKAETHVGSEKEPSSPAPKKSNKLMLGAVAAVAFIAIILVIAFFPKGNDPDRDQATTDVTPDGGMTQPDAVPDSGDGTVPARRTAMFYSGDEDEFRDLLADDSVESIVMASSLTLFGPDSLEITKPVVIRPGISLGNYSHILVAAGGSIRIEGELWSEGFIRLRDGGAMTVVPEGALTGSGVVWCETSDDISVEDSSFFIHDDVIMTLSETEVFADAVTVKSQAELMQVLNSGDPSPIIVDGNLEVSSHLYIINDLIITEGSYIQAPNGIHMAENSVLVNYGTLDGTLQFSGDGNSSIINYNTMNLADGGFGYGRLINYGDINQASCYIVGSTIVNVGRHILQEMENSWFDFEDAFYINHGDFLASTGEFPIVNMTAGTRIVNTGQMRAENGSTFVFDCSVNSPGSIEIADGGELHGSGIIEMESSDSQFSIREDGELYFNGIILYHGDAEPYLGSENNERARFIRFSWYDPIDDAIYVMNADELRRALANNDCTHIVIEGNVDLGDNDIELTKSVAITGKISTTGSITVSGEFLINHGNIEAESSVILDSGTTFINGSALSCGDLRFRNSSWMLISHGSVDVENSIDIAEASRIINIGWIDIDCLLNIGQYSQLCSLRSLNLNGATVIINADGQLISSNGSFFFSDASIIDNNGLLYLESWEDQVYTIAGLIRNNGIMEICNSGTDSVEFECVTGVIENYGTLKVGSKVPVNDTGAVHNYGTIIYMNDDSSFVLFGNAALDGNKPVRG